MKDATTTPKQRLFAGLLTSLLFVAVTGRATAAETTTDDSLLPVEIAGFGADMVIVAGFVVAAVVFVVAVGAGRVEASENDQNVVFLMLVGGAIAAYFLSHPQVYVLLPAALYGAIAYRTTYVEHEVTYPFHHVFSEMEPHEDAAGETWIGGGLLVALFVLTLWNPVGIENNVLMGAGAMAIASYALTHRQQTQYEPVYAHLRLDTSSRTWLLPARVAVVLSAGLILVEPGLFWPVALGFFVPFLTDFAFHAYFTETGDRDVWEKRWGEHRSNVGGAYVENKGMPAIEEFDVDYEVREPEEPGEGDAGAKLELSLTLDIPRPMQQWYRPWASLLIVATQVRRVMHTLGCVDDEEEKEYEAFYEDVVRVGGRQLEETKVGLQMENYPEHLVQEIHTQRAKVGEVTMEDIVDGERESDDAEVPNPERYADVQRWE